MSAVILTAIPQHLLYRLTLQVVVRIAKLSSVNFHYLNVSPDVGFVVVGFLRHATTTGIVVANGAS